MSGFLGVPVDAAYHLVSALTRLLIPFAGGLAAAAAIVLFTAAVRLLISPLSFRALRGQAALARLAPQVQKLRTRYGGQPERFQRELTALYRREGTGPFASILPVLAQWPFLSVMYLLFRSATVGGAHNQLLSDALFGVPLGAHWLSGAAPLSVHNALFLAVFAVLAALCWLRVDVTETIDAKMHSITAHASQFSGRGLDTEMYREHAHVQGRIIGVPYAEGFRHYRHQPYPREPMLQQLLGDAALELAGWA